VLGVRPSSPGFKHFRIEPYLDNLRWAKGRIPTPNGNIEVSWKKEKSAQRLLLNLSFPKECRAHVALPIEKRVKELRINGKQIDSGKKDIPVSPGIRYLGTEGSRMLFDIVEGGDYELQVEK
jgi:hypothetical protein